MDLFHGVMGVRFGAKAPGFAARMAHLAVTGAICGWRPLRLRFDLTEVGLCRSFPDERVALIPPRLRA